MKQILLASLTSIVMSCSTAEQTTSTTDSTATDNTVSYASTIEETQVPADVLPDSLLAKPRPEFTGSDSLYNILVREKLLIGKFDSLYIISENFLDISNTGSDRKLMVALIKTVDSADYSLRKHSGLGVFDITNGAKLVSYKDLSTSITNYTQREGVKAQPIELMPGKEAVEVHFLFSNDGTGDVASTQDDVIIFALVDGRVEAIINYKASDFSYSSAEEAGWSQTTISTTVTIGELAPASMPTIELLFITERSSSEESDEGTPDDERERKALYAFDGKAYVEQEL